MRPETSAERLQAREKLLAGMNSRSSPGSGRSFGGMERFYDQAFDTLTTNTVNVQAAVSGTTTFTRDSTGHEGRRGHDGHGGPGPRRNPVEGNRR